MDTPPVVKRLDRYDAGEFAGIAGLAAFCWFVWPPLVLLVASLALLVEVNLRSAGRAPVRSTGPSVAGRLRSVGRAAVRAWKTPSGEGVAA
jgi:hypothetical protein